ncbi:MAG: hypothetical protein DYG92_13565 [Leptolyngbya sp. PLA1]|nr:hypothetical protein [Leptolyngbya sp. PLA1]
MALAQDALTSASLRLPEAVSVRAIGHRNNEAMFFDQWQVVETPDGVWAQQDWYEGGAGFVPITLTISDASETFLYDIRSRRGNRGDRYAQWGTTRVDGLATPLAWVRYANHALERGDKVDEVTDPTGKLVVTLSAPRMSGRSFECTINRATNQLEEVRRADGSFVRYTDWRDIGGGLHFPFAVEHYTPAMGQVPPLTRRYQLDSAEAVDAKAPLPAFPLPPDAIVVDDRTGEVRNGAGERLNVDASALPPVPVPMASPVPLNLSAATPRPVPEAPPDPVADPAGRRIERGLLLLGAALAVTGLIMYAVRHRVERAREGAHGSPRSQAR